MANVNFSVPGDTQTPWGVIVPSGLEMNFENHSFYAYPTDPKSPNLFTEPPDDPTSGRYDVGTGGLLLHVSSQAKGHYVLTVNSTRLQEPTPNDGEIIVDSVDPGEYRITARSGSGPVHRFAYKRSNQ